MPDLKDNVLSDVMASDAKVEKRDGRVVDFDKEKISDAIRKSFVDLSKDVGPQEVILIDNIATGIFAEIRDRYSKPVRIAEIQRMVEDSLVANHLYDVAKNYTQYRFNRDVERSKVTDINEAVNRLINKDPTLVHENANKDSNVYATQRDLLAGAVSKASAFSMLPPAVATAHLKGEIHFHDADYSPFTCETNCSLPNFWNMLDNGFELGNAPMGSPNSIGVAATQITQIIKDIAGDQYGGQTANRLDEHLVKYAEKDYRKFLEDAQDDFPDGYPLDMAEARVKRLKAREPKALHLEDGYSIPESNDYIHKDFQGTLEGYRETFALLRTRKVIYDAMQTMEYQINSNRVSNGQTPFVTVGFGLGISWFAREIQRAIFLNRIRGLGSNHCTAIFPKLVFTIKHGVNSEPDDPNYDLKQLALECASKRMYPDIVFYENIVKITGDFKAPMGCVDRDEMVVWKDAEGIHTTGIYRLWDSFAGRFTIKMQPNGSDAYIDVPEGLEILDSHTGTPKFVKVKRLVRNSSKSWRKVVFSNGRSLLCTPDHPLHVKGRGRVFVEDLHIGDEIDRSVIKYPCVEEGEWEPFKAWLLGLILCDGCLNDPTCVSVSFAADGTEDAIYDRIREMYPDDKLRLVLHERGYKGTYYDLSIKDKALRDECVNLFGGTQKIYRHVPSRVFTSSKEVRLAFLGGMIDADGYVSKGTTQKVSIGSTNRELALGEMYLFESLGCIAKMYLNYYKSTASSVIRNLVEVRATPELVSYVACDKKRDKVSPTMRINRTHTELVVREVHVEDSYEAAYSYDVTTETDYFDVSGIVSHNCRSFLQKWVNPETGEAETDGRMNLGVVSVNIPRIAIESKGNKEKFWKIFNERMDIAHQALQFRIMRCKQATPLNAPTLYQYGAFGRIGTTGNVDTLFRNERATVSLGYIGLAETVAEFYGKDWIKDHSWNEEGRQFALSIAKRMSDLCKQWSKEEGYHYSLYSTPAESLTDRFNRMDREKYGRIPGITDHDFYTNSFHYPVWLQPTPMEKLQYEVDFPYYASGGFINYCEFPCLQSNLKALEAVWDYAHDLGIGYLGTNTPIDHCYVCGFEGDFEPTEEGFKCPECGNTDPSKCNVTKRTCGYLGNPVQRPMVHGRHEEIAHRVKHMSGETGHVTLADGSDREWFEEAK